MHLFFKNSLFVSLLISVISTNVFAQDVQNMGIIVSDNSLKIELKSDQQFLQDLKYNLRIIDDDVNEIFYESELNPEKNGTDNRNITFLVENLHPTLWTPTSPKLYTAEFTIFSNNRQITKNIQKIGFRLFEVKDGNFFLNGNPIFLRGHAINPPGRGIPSDVTSSREFVEEYIGFMKSININILRFPGNTKDIWYDVCDEMGMMTSGGNYSAKVNGEDPPTDYDKAVEWLINKRLGPIAHHPSLVIYVINNETPFGIGKKGQAWLKFQTYAHQELLKWDHTKVYIGNAGYGYGKAGDVCDLHRYWGWYYNSAFTFLNIRNSKEIIPFDKPVYQPITFTECVGNYIGPNGFNNLTPNNKNPQSQLNWTGHASWEEQPIYANDHQSFTYRMATELFRRLRNVNHDLSGVFPFTIIFDNWNTISKFSDMSPKPVTQQIKRSFQPILLSWECWTPNLYSGSTFYPIVHIVNDDNNFKDLSSTTLIYSIEDKSNNSWVTDSLTIPAVEYYNTYEKRLSLKIPAYLPMGWYNLKGKLMKGETVISENFTSLFIAGKDFFQSAPSNKKEILLYDPDGKTGKAVSSIGLDYKMIKSFDDLKKDNILIIGESDADEIIKEAAEKIKKYIHLGGRALILRQNGKNWKALNSIVNTPILNLELDIDKATYPRPEGASRNGYNINPERPEHLIFSGITRRNLLYWDDYTNWDESKKGFPTIHPVTDGFILANKTDMASTSVLANYGPGLNAIAIAEFYHGDGSILFCGLDLANRADLDPIAGRLLRNMIAYTSEDEQHALFPLITSPIIWGDYESEKGILTGEISGLLLNPIPRYLADDRAKFPLRITKEGHQFAANNTIGWADLPGLQYVPFGRRPYGPYYLRGMGSIAQISDNANKNEGEGSFFCRIPSGKSKVKTTVWNPVSEELFIGIQVNNDKIVSKLIPPGMFTLVECPVNSTDIKITIKGDRRLVLLQTSFE